MLTVLALVAGLTTVAATVAPVPSANAATVTIGTIQAQQANHVGVNNGASGNCIKYAPAGTNTSSSLVSSPNEAITAHGRPDSKENSCPNNLNTNTQSAVGFRPSATTSAEDGQTFLIGRMIHYNNPVYADDRYFTGQLVTVLGGFTSPNSVTFDWQLDETPNSGGNNCCDDVITFTNQISTVTLTQGGLNFRLVILGFVPTTTTATCPATPPEGSSVQNEFKTVEGTQTHACLYASLSQVRSLTIVKTVTGTSPPAKPFAFTSSSALAGSPWSNGTFSLAGGGSLTQSLTSGNTVTVTETDPADDRWSLTALTCTQIGANGQPQAVPEATLNVAARQVVLSKVPPPPLPAQPGITCTYTNTYTPKATLTLVKQVQSGTATPNLWTLTATGSTAPPPSGATISGPSGSSAVSTQRVPAGSYALTEIGTGAAATGYVQVGDWACRTVGGATVPVTGGSVTLPDSAAGATSANVTCTVTNRQAAGSLRITKVVSAPAGAYTGGDSKTFSGTYDCGSGFAGSFATLTRVLPVVISGIPAGRTCTVAETPPTGGLANASYAWAPATYSAQPVTIVDGGPATVTITNPVVQRFGTFAVTKVIDGPGGYIGGTGRVFPVGYSCTLTNGPTTAGTVEVTTAQAVSPDTPIPTGSVCSFTETLATQGGDFADPSYAWTGSAVSPTSVTIGDNTTASVTLTNSYARETGSLVIAKVVQGDGYLGGTAENFTVRWDCGVASGTVTLAAGGSKTVTVPARNACAVQETSPRADLLSPAYVWGTPTWSPAPVATVPANGSVTLTVTNPTVPIFGRVSVSKAVTGAVDGVTADAQFTVRITCDNGDDTPFTIGVGGTATTGDLPVGTVCTVTEQAPSGGLLDSSYAWGEVSIPGQPVTISSSGQVVAVTVTNSVIRVRGGLTITKAPIAGGSVVDPDRAFVIDYSCAYGNDAAVADSVSLTAGESATIPDLLLGTSCTVTEDPDTLTAPPDPTDPSWVWLPPTYSPGQNVVVDSDATPVAVTVTNRIQRLTGGFNLSKVVTGAGKEGGYAPGDTFEFDVQCGDVFSDSVNLADTQGFAAGPLPVGTICTIEELSQPPTDPAFAWDPVQFIGPGVSQSGNTATFTIAENSIQVNAINTITPQFSSVQVTKAVSGLIAGLSPTAPPFSVTLNCGPGLIFPLSVPAGGSATQDGIPVGSVCTATESTPSPDGLVDASYAWGPPTYDPADATQTVVLGSTVVIGVTNPIVRVYAPVRLVKSYSGPQGVVDPAFTYPITWSCEYLGTVVGGGTVDVIANPDGVTLADQIPLTSTCSATEDTLDPPSNDPAFRWLPPVISPVGEVTLAEPNIITVANTLTRDTGIVRVEKVVTGETAGYIGTGPEFTLHGQCLVPGQPQIPTRYADGSIADGGTVDIVASVGWTCSGFEDTPGQNLLQDPSYGWVPPVITGTPPLAADGTFVLPSAGAVQVFRAENPIVRVRDSLTITKAIVDPNGIVLPSAQFTGTFRCVYGDDETIVEGPWTITPASDRDFVVPDLLLGSVCSVTENDPGTTGLPNSSWAWGPALIGDPDTVVVGATGSVTVTNTPIRLYAGLRVTKTVTDPDGGLVPGSTFGGAWQCDLGADSYSGRFSVAANGSSVLFAPADELVPATAVCSVTEDTLDNAVGLRDGSFAWGEPSYDPADVTLQTGQTATLGVTNTVVRVYSDVSIRKVVIGPANRLVPSDRPFTGDISCQYGTDAPVVTTWSATQATPALRAGVLVGSTCVATEDPPGGTGSPVTGDSSYIWLPPVVSAPVVVTAPETVTPPIVVTNPTDRLFGTFSVNKTISGAVGGIVNPQGPYAMTYSCQPGVGPPIVGDLEIPLNESRSVGPERQIPINSECTLTEPLGTMPPPRDDAWAWDDPTFTVDGVPTPGAGRSLTFVIPNVQEDIPEPTAAIVVNNNVTKTAGEYAVSKSSDPPSGAVVEPGSTITYTLTVDSTGSVPVHDVVVTDDLAGVLPYATVVDGSITAPSGTSAVLDPVAQNLIWTVGDVAATTSLALTYQVTVNPGAAGILVQNGVTATGDVPPSTCAAEGVVAPLAAAAVLAAPCTTEHPTPAAPTIGKESTGPAAWDPVTATWTVGYRIVAGNPNPDVAVPYTLTDPLGFPAEVEIESAAVTLVPDGVTPASPAWDGVDAVTIVENATLPAGATHVYEVRVTVFVPSSTSASTLSCLAGSGAAGNGLFNQVSLDSLGSLLSATACESVPAVLSVDKQWVINGFIYPDGTQPAGFSATLLLGGVASDWNTDYVGYPPGTVVDVSESATLAAGCTSTASGTGPTELSAALTEVTVVNTVTCAGPVPPPPNPPYPPYPPLPDTGFGVGPYVGWGIGLIVAGALFLIGSAYRRRGLAG